MPHSGSDFRAEKGRLLLQVYCAAAQSQLLEPDDGNALIVHAPVDVPADFGAADGEVAAVRTERSQVLARAEVLDDASSAVFVKLSMAGDLDGTAFAGRTVPVDDLDATCAGGTFCVDAVIESVHGTLGIRHSGFEVNGLHNGPL